MDPTCTPALADLVSEVGSLPSAAAAIVALTVDPDCEVEDLVRAIGADPAMAMRFLALANSAAIARGRPVADIRGAVVRLGLRRVRNVALLMGAHDMLPPGSAVPGLDAGALWRHNLAVAAAAQALAAAGRGAQAEDAWLAGLLQGVGVAALARRDPRALTHALALARAERLPLRAAEHRILGFDHADLAAGLLRTWHLPPLFADAIACPAAGTGPAAAALARLLGVAVTVVRAAGFGDAGDRDPRPTAAAAAAAAGLGLADLEDLAGLVAQDLEATARFLGVDLGATDFTAALASARDALARLGLEGIDQALAREDLEEQLAVARTIQQRLLPAALASPAGWEVAAANHPSRHVSGDIYDVLPVSGGRTAVLIADVSGKGLPAALLATSLQATVRALGTVMADPGRLLTAANAALVAATDDEHFATVFLAVLAADGGSLTYASAGHLPPLLLRAGGAAQWLRPAGLPVGLMPGTVYPVQTITMAPTDTLVAITDGVTEAADAEGREFGRAGFEQTARGHAASPLPTLVGAVETAVLGRTPDRRPGDDLTILALRPRA